MTISIENLYPVLQTKGLWVTLLVPTMKMTPMMTHQYHSTDLHPLHSLTGQDPVTTMTTTISMSMKMRTRTNWSPIQTIVLAIMTIITVSIIVITGIKMVQITKDNLAITGSRLIGILGTIFKAITQTVVLLITIMIMTTRDLFMTTFTIFECILVLIN